MNMELNHFPLLPHSHSHEHHRRGSALLLSGCPRMCSSQLPSNHLAEVARSATVLATSVLARLMPSWPPVWSSVTPRARPRKPLRLLWRQPWRRWASKSNTTPSARCEGYVTRTLPVLRWRWLTLVCCYYTLPSSGCSLASPASDTSLHGLRLHPRLGAACCRVTAANTNALR